MREAARHVDVFLAPSRTMAERFQRFGVRDMRLCNQGIDLAPFAGLAREASPLLRVAFAAA